MTNQTTASTTIRHADGRRRWIVLLACLMASPLTLSETRSNAMQPGEAVPGEVYSWQLPRGADEVRFNDDPVMVVNQTALVGVGLGQPLGPAELSYRLDGQRLTHTFQVRDKTYTEQHLTIANQAMVDPPAATLARIRDEGARQRRLYASYASVPDALLEGARAGFRQPLEGIVTSLFGHRRFFNGKPRNPHSGLDIAAASGTPIIAAGAATVTLADDLYFNGKTLFLDHGQGLITMYCHMSELKVAPGDRVEQGDVIGLVGATGRVTGAHLHWSVSLNGNRIDPPTFVTALNSALGLSGTRTLPASP